jgi:hypothetical protein
MESGKMGSLKKNGLAILGWVVFAGLSYLISKLLFAWVALQVSPDSSFLETHPLLLRAILVLCSFLIGFSAFTISLKFVVFPIIRRQTAVSVELKYPLSDEWILFCIVFVICTLPIGYVEALLDLLNVPDTTIRLLRPAWRAVISLWFYRDSVLTYASAQIDQVENTELQMQESA